MKKPISLLALVAHASAFAVCSNPLTSVHNATHLVVGENGKGCWAAWPNDERTGACLVVAVKDKCNSATARKAVAAWITDRGASFTTFGANPYTDPALRAVWEPESDRIKSVLN